MSETVLLLGPIAFRDFEVASGISFGGVQRMAEHDLPGGGRVIDALGDSQGRITVSGALSGPDATERARALAALRGAGSVLPMTWNVFFYSVLVQSFQAEFRSAWWIPFRLTCAVLRDEATAAAGDALSLVGSLGADLASAIGFAPDSIDLGPAAALLAAPGATTRGTAAYESASGGLTAATFAFSAALGSGEARFDPNAVFAAGSAAEGAAAIDAAALGAGRLAGLSAAGAYVRRASANLLNAST